MLLNNSCKIYKKQCKFEDNICKKQYRVYIKYKSSEKILDKEICETIIIKNDIKNKCILTEGTNGVNERKI